MLTILYLYPIKSSFMISIQCGNRIFFDRFKNGVIKRIVDISSGDMILVNIYNDNRELILTSGKVPASPRNIDMYIPKDSIRINSFSFKDLAGENVVCYENYKDRPCAKLYTAKRSAYEKLDSRTIDNKDHIGIRQGFVFYKQRYTKQFKDIEQTDFSHTKIQSPVSGLIKSVKVNNYTLIKSVPRDDQVFNPLNGRLIESKINGEYAVFKFMDENFFSQYERPRFLYNHTGNNQLCLNRENPEFYQKRDEPELIYIIVIKKNDIIKRYKGDAKGKKILDVRSGSDIFTAIFRDVDISFKNNRDYFTFRNETIGEII